MWDVYEQRQKKQTKQPSLVGASGQSHLVLKELSRTQLFLYHLHRNEIEIIFKDPTLWLLFSRIAQLQSFKKKKKSDKCWQGYWVPMKIQVCVRSVLLTFHCYLEFAATHALDTVLTCGINLDCSQHRLLYFTSSSTFVWITLLAKMIIYVTFCCRIFYFFC